MVVVGLVEEHVLAVLALDVGCVLLEDAVGAYAVLFDQLLPKLCANYNKSHFTLIAALTNLNRHYLSWHFWSEI